MKKKYMLPFFSLLLLFITITTIFIILILGSKSTSQETATTLTPTPWLTPTSTTAVTPIITPEPTKAPKAVTKLYPAYQIVNDEILYGYIDQTGTFIIPPSFHSAADFHDGIAIVTLKDTYCAIDEGGNIRFTSDIPLEDFSNGLSAFSSAVNNDTFQWGYRDAVGNITIQAKYDKASNFMEDGTAYVSKGKDKYALIDKTGKELETYELASKYESLRSPEDGYLIYSGADANKYGVINVKGEEILKPIYSEIAYLGNGLFAVKSPKLEDYGDIMAAKQAIFNASGEQLTDYSFYDISSYHGGYCSASDDSSTFFVGLDGKVAENLPKFDGSGMLKLFGDVISAEIDQEQFYCTLDKNIFWQLPDSYALTNTITVKKIKFKPNRNVLVYYPQVEGLEASTVQEQINAKLKSIFTDSRASIKVGDMLTTDDSFSAKITKNLLIIEKDGYDYGFGAAHGMPIKDFLYIDVKTGTFYQLKDLFTAKSDYITKINELITDDIAIQAKSEDSMLFPDSFQGIAEDQCFRLEEDALVIYFYPYAIAAYAAGFPEFDIPFADIMDYIDTEGAFWKSFHDAE